METIVLKKYTTKLAVVAPAIRSLVAIATIFIGATAASMPAEATPISLVCRKVYNTCLDSCKTKWVSMEFRRACNARCRETLKSCHYTQYPTGNVQTPPDPITPKGGQTHTPPTGGTRDEPKPLPPRVNDPRAPTTGGTKTDPKISPKVNDTRAPLGDGVFHPKTSGSGTSGPILRSGGASAPVQKPNGGSGPNLKSSGR